MENAIFDREISESPNIEIGTDRRMDRALEKVPKIDCALMSIIKSNMESVWRDVTHCLDLNDLRHP